jgi:molecular chaperone DnaK (HSP70)
MGGSGWALAIDFGTSFTTAAMTRPGDHAVEPIMLEVENSRYLPSVVLRDEAGELLTGRVAATQAPST